MKKTVNWKKIWADFDEWHDNPKKEAACKNCGHTESPYKNYEWEEQQAKIQQLVDAQVREIVEKKI